MSEKLKIGMFVDSYFPRKDGCSYTVKAWKEKLKDRGHTVYVIYPDGEYQPGENEMPVKSVNNPWYKGHSWPLPLSTRKFPELDIVHCHSQGPLGLLGRYYAWRNNLPAIYTQHTPLEEYAEGFFPSKILARILSKIYISLETAYLKTFDTVTANTGEINRSVEATELSPGVDTDFFKPKKDRLLTSEDYKKPYIGYSGRLSEEKNIEEVLELAERFEGTVFIVGNGRHEEELKSIAPDNVVFNDYLPREKLPVFYSEIDVFVISSVGDTFNLASLEANACGTPVVAPDIFPFNHTIGKENGERYELGDIDDFEEKLSRCLQKSYSSREAVKSYSLNSTAEKLEKIYQRLAV